MDDVILVKLRTLAPRLNQLTFLQDAGCFYEMLSGGLVWMDEIPDVSTLPVGTFEGLRGVIRYRTTLILGEPDEGYHALWLEAQKLFPNWPGFAADRRSIERRPMCQELKSKAVQEMDKLFDE